MKKKSTAGKPVIMKPRKYLSVLLAVIMMLAVCSACTASEMNEGDSSSGETAVEEAAPLSGPAELRKTETAADADEWIRIFLGENPEELDGAWAMTDQMQSAAERLGGMKGMAQSLAQLGTLEEISPAYEGELQGYKVFYIPCVFSNISVDLVLVTDQGLIAGLNTGAYTGGAGQEENSALFDSIDLALPVPSMNKELPGTLTVPKGDGPFPAVVLIHGSGPCDRDESVGNLKPFKDLAEGLAEKGIAVYRFDKRTYVYGSEMMNDHQITLVEESIEDAVNAVQLLAAQEKIDPDRILVLGHSLGGNAVPAIAGELEQAPVKACGFIMMAASPRPLDELMREQYDYLYSLLPEVTEEQQAEKDALFSELDRLKDPDALTDDDMIAGAYAPYWKWLADYDVLKEAEGIAEPCLLLQGEEDYQVTMEDFAIWQEAVGEKENWQLISYPGLIHAFTQGQKTEGAAAYSRNEKVDPQVIEDIAGFISSFGAAAGTSS